MAPLTFLTILPEIRELIYTIHLTTPDPVQSPSVTRANRFSHRDRFGGWPWDKDVRYHMDDCIQYRDPTTNPIILASLPLLLCNRQINAEVSSTISFLTTHTKELWYEIDCEVVDEVALYPTWLHVPIHFKEAAIPCLYANFRISGQLEPDRRSNWAPGCGGPGMMVWGLMELLNRFLERGPNFIASRVEAPSSPAGPPTPTLPSTSATKSARVTGKFKLLKNRIFSGKKSPNSNPVRSLPVTPLPEPDSSAQVQSDNQKSNNIRIEKLVINFGSDEFCDPTGFYFLDDDDKPLNVVNFVKRRMDFLFNGSQSTIEYSRFIASRVGSVHLLCDGENIAQWDLLSLRSRK